MRTATALAALILALGAGLAQPAQAQQDPLALFLRALATDVERAVNGGVRYASDADDDDDDRDDDDAGSGGRDDDDDDGGSDDNDDDNDD
jgi:hypothetical protein